jgi:GNAT superfamily N-acetyltransferase
VEPGDVEAIGRLIHIAFKDIADARGFPPDFPTVDAGTELARAFVAHPSIWGIAAVRDGEVVGSNFLDQRNEIPGVGPITVAPGEQGTGLGRVLMEAVIERGRGAPGIRLVQDAFNTVSMSLYASLGFDVREPLVRITGHPAGEPPADLEVVPLAEDHVSACAALCRRVHGIDRGPEIGDSLPSPLEPYAALREGRVVAYATSVAFWPLAHGVAENEEDLTALLIAASRASAAPIDILLPTRQAELFRWALRAGLRVVKPMSLMTIGHYEAPRGAWFPSVQY